MKVYKIDQNQSKYIIERIVQETNLLKSLSHCNIVQLYEIFRTQDYVLMVQEYLDGGDLMNILQAKNKFTLEEFLPIFGKIVNGLKYLHNQGILHRDIKLDNVFINKRGEVKIGDFGVSIFVDKDQRISEQIGTPAYIAPEIIGKRGYSGF